MPQAREANLTAFLHRVRGLYSGRVPEDFGGVCNIDFEGWQTNVWEWIWCPANGNHTHGVEYRTGYQTFSELLVERDHPGWTPAQITAQAKREFEAAATHWLVETLNVVKSLSPKCHWGYFGSPSVCSMYGPCAKDPTTGEQRCGFDHPTAGPAMRALAAKQRPVQEASTALYPALYAIPSCVADTEYEILGCHAGLPNCTAVESVYNNGPPPERAFFNSNASLQCGCDGMPNSTIPDRYTQCAVDELVPHRSLETDRAWISSVVAQAVRGTDARVPVIPYIWQYCEGGPCYESKAPPYTNNRTTRGQDHVGREMVKAMVETPYSAGAAATLFWIDRESIRPHDGLVDLLHGVTGPLTKDFLGRVNTCAATNCSGHGRCVPVGSGLCECTAGRVGAKCERAAAGWVGHELAGSHSLKSDDNQPSTPKLAAVATAPTATVAHLKDFGYYYSTLNTDEWEPTPIVQEQDKDTNYDCCNLFCDSKATPGCNVTHPPPGGWHQRFPGGLPGRPDTVPAENVSECIKTCASLYYTDGCKAAAWNGPLKQCFLKSGKANAQHRPGDTSFVLGTDGGGNKLSSWDLTPVALRGNSQAQLSMYGSPKDATGLAAMIVAMRHHGLGTAFDPLGISTAELNTSLARVLVAANLSYVSFYGGGDAQVPDGDSPGTSLTAASIAGLQVSPGRHSHSTRALTTIDCHSLGISTVIVLSWLSVSVEMTVLPLAIQVLNASTTVAVQFGEFGYFFHCLQQEASLAWWHVVYPNPTDFARHQHEITPVHLMGYRSMPASHAEAYAAFTEYVQKRRRDYQDWMGAMLTGLHHYAEMYAAKWGADMISMEVGADVADPQSKIAFARGSSRRHRIPWSLQVSPWYIGSCTTHGPVVKNGNTWTGSAAGHSISFVRRMMLQAWFAGAALITPENSINSFFDVLPTPGSPGVLSPHGQMGRDVNAFITSHDRGTPFIPVLVIIDEHAGYSNCPCNWSGVRWGIFSENSQAMETRHLNNTTVPVSILQTLFEGQLFPKAGRGVLPDTAENGQLRPTPFGELVDVGLSGTPQKVLAAYKSILLAGGDIDFNRVSAEGGTTLATELASALSLEPDLKLLMQPYHVDVLQKVGGFAALNASGRLEVLNSPGVAISNDRLARLRDRLLPFSVTANVTVAWQVNRLESGAGWVVALRNNDGVFKTVNATATYNVSLTSAVKVVSHFSYAHSVTEWDPLGTDRQLSGPGVAGTPVHTVLAPGASRFLHFKSDDKSLPDKATDFRPFERNIWPVWRERFSSGPGAGEFSMRPGHPTSLYGSADMLMSDFILGRLNITAPSATSLLQWADTINSFQLSDSGIFTVQSFEYHFPGRDSDYEHQTAFAAAALRLVGHTPRYRLTKMQGVAANTTGWDNFLAFDKKFWWSRVSGTLAALATTGDKSMSGEFARYCFDWLDERAQNASGYWPTAGGGSAHTVREMDDSVHPLWTYYWLKHPWRHARAMVDTGLAMQNASTGWFTINADKSFGGVTLPAPGCGQLDGLYTVARSSVQLGRYRWPEVRTMCSRFLRRAAAVMNVPANILHNEDFNQSSHILNGALQAVAECAKWFPELLKTDRPWRISTDFAPYMSDDEESVLADSLPAIDWWVEHSMTNVMEFAEAPVSAASVHHVGTLHRAAGDLTVATAYGHALDPPPLHSAWYFRGVAIPEKPYPTPGDGRSYASAWRQVGGAQTIDWASVKPGDTLYLCGRGCEVLSLPPRLAGKPGLPITIDGSCPMHDGSGGSDPVMWVGGAPFRFPQGWAGPDSHGLYSLPRKPNTWAGHAVLSSDVHSTAPATLSRLSPGNCTDTGQPVRPEAWAPGSIGQGKGGSMLYYKPAVNTHQPEAEHGGGSLPRPAPASAIIYGGMSSPFHLVNASNVVLTNIRLFGVASFLIEVTDCTDVTISNSHVQWAHWCD